MALPGARVCCRKLSSLGIFGRPFSSSVVSYTSTSAAVELREELPNTSHNQLLTVQTHTGIGNMGHALHILRAIEKEYGPIESYLFPREPGSGDYLPNFFFKFRNVQSLYKLSKPYTHLDVPAFLPQLEPNHAIGLEDIHTLVSPATFPPLEGKDYPSDPIKARFAIRIEISDKQAFPQQRPSPQANAAQKLGRIQRALATWQPAASLVRSSNEEITRPQVGSSNAPTKIFDLPAGSVAPPQAREETSSQQERASSALQPKPGLAYSPPLRMRPRASRRQVVANPLQTDSDATSAESRTIANSVDSESVTAFHIDLPARSVQLPSSKRERILEQARRAAATEAKLIADQKAATEAASASAEQTHEIDKPQVRRNIPLSIWSRFLGR